MEPALWCKVIHDKYGYYPPFSLNDIMIPSNGVPWKNICLSLLLYLNAKTIALSRVRKRLGDGSSTLFWHDLWVGVSPLNILFSSLFLLSMTQIIQYLQWVCGTFNWDWSPAWRRDLRPHDILEFEQLFSSLNQVSLNASSHDNFVLNLDKVGNFSVKSLMKELGKISRHIPADNLKKVQRGMVPHRIEIFVWFVLMGKINSRVNASKLRIIPFTEALCIFCNCHIQTEDYLFLHCDFASEILSWGFSSWRFHWCIPLRLRDSLYQGKFWDASPLFNKVWMTSYFIIP